MLHSTSFTTSDALVLLGGSIGTHLTANRTKFHDFPTLSKSAQISCKFAKYQLFRDCTS